MNKLRTKLLSELREAIRLKHYSLKTEKSSIHWVRWFTFVCTESRVIIVRMSEDWGEFDQWPAVFRDLATNLKF